MSSNASNTTSANSKPSTDPEAARTAAQTDHRHHPVPVPDQVPHAQGVNKNSTEKIEADTSAYPENQTKDKSAASPEKVAHRTTN